MSCDIKTPYADAEGMLPQMKGSGQYGMSSHQVRRIVLS